MAKYFPEGDKSSSFTVYGYSVAQTLVQVLKQCGDNLTRENVMKQAANLKNLELPLLIPGVKVNTTPADFYPIEQMQLMHFNGEHGNCSGLCSTAALAAGQEDRPARMVRAGQVRDYGIDQPLTISGQRLCLLHFYIRFLARGYLASRAHICPPKAQSGHPPTEFPVPAIRFPVLPK